MTAWGVAPARGHLQLCGCCGATVAFVQAGRAGQTPESTQRTLQAIALHLRSSPKCENASTFAGREVLACRCVRPLRLPRDDGLMCARCEGLIAPEVASPPSPQRNRRTTGGAR